MSTLSQEERDALLQERALLEQQVRELAVAPIVGKSEAAKRFRQEDLLALAKKMTKIDKQLGRI